MAQMTKNIRFDNAEIAGLPNLMWKVSITARCPDCGDDCSVGSTHSGKTVVKCSKCKFSVSTAEIQLQEAVKVICELAVKSATPKTKE